MNRNNVQYFKYFQVKLIMVSNSVNNYIVAVKLKTQFLKEEIK